MADPPMAPHADLIRLGRKPTWREYLRSIWARRQFATSVPLGELKAQNMDTVMGGLWHLLNPLLLVGVYYIMFGLILQRALEGTENYVTFLTIGIFVFFYSRKSIQAGAKSIVSNLTLIRSIRFPRAILPLAAVLGETVALGPAIAAMLAVVLLTGYWPQSGWLLIIPLFALQALFNFGAAMIVARVTDHFHDTQQFLGYALQMWFYLSGVLYPVETLITDPGIRALFLANPAYLFVTLMRDAVMQGTLRPHLLLYATVWSVAIFVIGAAFFRAREESYGRG